MDHLSNKLDKLSLEGVYTSSDYQILDPKITFRCDQINEQLDQYLRLLGKRSWIFISAANPRSVIQDEKTNAWRNTNLEIDIAKTGFHYAYAVGLATDGHWPAEDSFMVFDIPIETGKALAMKYDQNAILFGRCNKPAQLEWIDDAPE